MAESFDPAAVRREFPVVGRMLYLDSAHQTPLASSRSYGEPPRSSWSLCSFTSRSTGAFDPLQPQYRVLKQCSLGNKR